MEMPSPPMPVIEPLTEPFWSGAAESKLVIQQCSACGRYIHMPLPICSACHSFDLGFSEVSGQGTLYSFTETNRAFHPYFVDRLPYVVAVIELAEQTGLRLVTNLVDTEGVELTCDMPVEVRYVALSDELTIPAFAPLASAS